MDLQRINDVVTKNDVSLVVVGQALDDDGEATPSSRRAAKFGQGLVDKYHIEVVYCDEAGTTNEAKQTAYRSGNQA